MQKSQPPFALFLPILTVSLFFAVSVRAADSPGMALDPSVEVTDRIYKQSTMGEGAMTKKMIEACITRKHEIDTLLSKLSPMKERLDSLKKEKDDLYAELVELKDTADGADYEAAPAFREKMTLHQTTSVEYASLLKTYNDMVDPFQEEIAAYNKKCKNQSYYKDDYEAVVDKLGYGM